MLIVNLFMDDNDHLLAVSSDETKSMGPNDGGRTGDTSRKNKIFMIFCYKYTDWISVQLYCTIEQTFSGCLNSVILSFG